MATGPVGSRIGDRLEAGMADPDSRGTSHRGQAVFPSARPLELGAIRVHTPLILAPMAGVTDAPFRGLCREAAEEPLDTAQLGVLSEAVPRVDAHAGLFVAEMVTARALCEGDERAWSMVVPDPEEKVRSVQLYGTEPESLGQAAAALVERGLADHVDLNFGCPVPKVTRKGGGAAIPWKRDLFRGIVRSVVRSVDRAAPEGPGAVPVTVKMRIGIDDDHITADDAALIAQAEGAAAVGLHARTQEQYYSGAARWEWISRLKEILHVPVFGNGDIFAAEDALKMMSETGCDAVVVGRGAQGRPWLFRDISAAMWGLPAAPAPKLSETREMILRHARRMIVTEDDEFRAMREMRKHVGWYLKGYSVGGEARRRLSLVGSLQELSDHLGDLDGKLALSEATAKRRGRAGSAKKPHLPYGWLDSQALDEAERQTLMSDDDGGSGG